MKCDQCGEKIENVLEKIEFNLGDDVIRIKNNPKTPVCQDCLQDAFFEVMDGLTEV